MVENVFCLLCGMVRKNYAARRSLIVEVPSLSAAGSIQLGELIELFLIAQLV